MQRTYTITVYGETDPAMQDALSEACRLMNEGNFAGINSNDEGGFSFESEEQ